MTGSVFFIAPHKERRSILIKMVLKKLLPLNSAPISPYEHVFCPVEWVGWVTIILIDINIIGNSVNCFKIINIISHALLSDNAVGTTFLDLFLSFKILVFCNVSAIKCTIRVP